ncbi:DUF1904 family protein [Halalkalibacter kiskunsagensis]|uniref:DUF1904 family protein n=1 Tax=Halalkalibacter kiskunsagensis TaxID=1548599 RepID=A0ABV6KAP3_9BACI
MPFLRFKGFEKKHIEAITPMLINEFSVIADVPKEIVKVELLEIEQITNSPSSVEIFMFQRKQETHDAIASMIYKKISKYGYDHAHIFYVILTHELYYKEGKPLQEIPKNRISTY